jgi:hypothetical protein
MPFRSKAGAQHSLSPYRCRLLGGDDTNQPQILEVVCSILYAKMNIGDGQTRGSVCFAHRRRIAHRGSSLTMVLTSRPQAVGGLRLRLADVSQHIREAADKLLHPSIFPLGRIQLEPIHGPVVFQHLMPGRVRDRLSFLSVQATSLRRDGGPRSTRGSTPQRV